MKLDKSQNIKALSKHEMRQEEMKAMLNIVAFTETRIKYIFTLIIKNKS